ncbi:DUF4097 family beta strand repeat-containing protein [Spirillospora sp. NPDC047279]|uniref:DUF4097 family beta strand repeat-containing protein n=1 Tax=Spirillospora sp. NPDC047279 TaxID=3155478 RepID=UPI0033FE13BA
MPAFETTSPIDATIEVTYGHVEVHAGERTDVVVAVRPTDPASDASVQAAERTEVDFSGGRLLVKDARGTGLSSLFGGKGSIDVTVELPTGSRLRVKGAADVEATGDLGETVVHSSHGDIHLERTERLDARSSNGEIRVERIAGEAELSATNGMITVGALEASATVKTSTGDVTVGTARADLTVKSAYGRLRIGEVARGTVRLETGHGKVHVGIADGTAAWLDVHTKFGAVRNSLTPSEEPGDTGESVAVHAHTKFGDIEIHRS